MMCMYSICTHIYIYTCMCQFPVSRLQMILICHYMTNTISCKLYIVNSQVSFKLCLNGFILQNVVSCCAHKLILGIGTKWDHHLLLGLVVLILLLCPLCLFPCCCALGAGLIPLGTIKVFIHLSYFSVRRYL